MNIKSEMINKTHMFNIHKLLRDLEKLEPVTSFKYKKSAARDLFNILILYNRYIQGMYICIIITIEQLSSVKSRLVIWNLNCQTSKRAKSAYYSRLFFLIFWHSILDNF